MDCKLIVYGHEPHHRGIIIRHERNPEERGEQKPHKRRVSTTRAHWSVVTSPPRPLRLVAGCQCSRATPPSDRGSPGIRDSRGGAGVANSLLPSPAIPIPKTPPHQAHPSLPAKKQRCHLISSHRPKAKAAAKARKRKSALHTQHQHHHHCRPARLEPSSSSCCLPSLKTEMPSPAPFPCSPRFLATPTFPAAAALVSQQHQLHHPALARGNTVPKRAVGIGGNGERRRRPVGAGAVHLPNPAADDGADTHARLHHAPGRIVR